MVLGLFLVSWLVVATAAPTSEWIEGGGYRYRDLTLSAPGRVFLAEVPPSETGITFTYAVAEERGAENTIRLGGTGVAAGDIDGDGRCDLFFCSMGGRS